jgi:hypothetical protein
VNPEHVGNVFDLHCFNDWIDDVEDLHEARRKAYQERYGDHQSSAAALPSDHLPDVPEQT